MKKKYIVLALILVVFISVCTILYIKTRKMSSYIEVTYSQLQDSLKKTDRFVLFIGAESCSHCRKFKKTVNKIVSEYQIKIYYIDLDKLEEEEYAYLNSHFPFTGTPTTVIIENGKELDRQIYRIEGSKDYDYTVKKLKKANIIE